VKPVCGKSIGPEDGPSTEVNLPLVSEGEPLATGWTRLARQPLLRQFAKFCLVGATSTAIDLGLFAALRTLEVPRLLAQTISFSFAVTNGFFWNRRWTFRAVEPERARRQYASFYLVNVVGFTLNTTLLYLFAHLFVTSGMPERRAELLGKALAVPVVAIWNFSASKFWAFAGPLRRES
jgi:putative flippase GtrA